MTQNDKLAMLMERTGELSDNVLSVYLSIAARHILNRAYPFKSNARKVPDKYGVLQVEIAAYIMDKRGAEGETVHVENGISRHYENGEIPESMLKTVIPFAVAL